MLFYHFATKMFWGMVLVVTDNCENEFDLS